MSEQPNTKFYSKLSKKRGYSWETPPAAIPEREISETHETEVLVVGGGISGLAAAARLAQMGKQVTVIDKNERQVALAGQIAGVNSQYMKHSGYHINPKKFAADWLKVSGSRIQEDLLWIFINRSGEGFDWLCDLAGGEDNLDISLYVPYRGEAFCEYYGTHHISKKPDCEKYQSFGGGFLACEILEKALEGFGGRIYRSTSALYLEKDAAGRVTGCVCTSKDGKTLRFTASRATVLATGDASDDDEMLEAFCSIGLRPSKRFPRKGNTGDGQKMAYWAGGILDNPEWAPTLHALGYSGYQFFFLHVNQRGERFMNEDTWMQAKSVRCLMQPGGDFAFSVFDSNWLDDLEKRWKLLGGQGMAPLSVVGQGFDRDALKKSIDGTINGTSVFGDGGENDVYVNGGNGFIADTLDELAEKIDIPADSLKKTVARYNQIVADGDDKDFGKRSELLTPIAKPPFIALKWGPSLLDVFGGALTNARLNVLDTNHDPILGLYAVGNAAGGMYAVDYPLLLNGNSYGRALAYALQLADGIAEDNE
jgi:succinate dehydrogenase/fumarate reductase flavoprotein subunit